MKEKLLLFLPIFFFFPFLTVENVANAQTIAAGEYHSLAICTDGTVWDWGNNESGQLGDNQVVSSFFSRVPVEAIGLSGIISLGGGGDAYSVALMSNGTVWSWGSSANVGSLGDNTTVDRYFPVQTVGISGITAVVAGNYHAVARKSDGTVWCWGYNIHGALGDNTTTDRYSPIQVGGGLNGVSAVGAGWGESIALKSDGTVWCWGDNDGGQCGDNTTVDKKLPVQVQTGASGCATNLCGITSIAGGNGHVLALKSDGTVWAWGWNNYKQLGDNTTTNRKVPVQTVGLSGIISIAADYLHSLALKSDGTVWAWGWNSSGQLGDNTTTDRGTPVQVIGLSGIVTLAAGWAHSLALKSNGTMWGWGENDSYGQIGDNTVADQYTPVQVNNLCSVLMTAPVPIELLSFTAKPIQQVDDNYTVRCNWTTVTEMNNNYFTVERSQDAYTFEQIGTVQGAGNSNMPLYYSFNDMVPYSGQAYYRLKQTDFNGNSKHSDIVPVFIGAGLDLINFYPNPVQEEVNIVIAVQAETEATLEVLNILGQQAIEKKIILNMGTTQTRINVSRLAKGDYLFRVILPNKTNVQKFFIK